MRIIEKDTKKIYKVDQFTKYYVKLINVKDPTDFKYMDMNVYLKNTQNGILEVFE